MPADQIFPDIKAFARHLRALRMARSKRVNEIGTTLPKRVVLSRAKRKEVFQKTGGRCHICGGEINSDDWQADHVLAHSTGGVHDVANYLPAHSLCNNYRWHYGTDEFQWILKLGVWLRPQIETKTSAGKAAGEKFVAYEQRRGRRRKKNS